MNVKKLLKIFAAIIVSLILFTMSYYLIHHGSSSAFEFGSFCGIAGLLHWIWWID